MAKEKKTSSPSKPKSASISQPMFDFSNLLSENQQRLFMYLFIGLAAILFVIRPIASRQFGPSSDEIYHKAIGDLSYDYLISGGKNDSIFHYDANHRDDASLLLNYGPILEVTATALYRNLGTDPWETRHVVLTLCTFLLFFYCGMAAYKIGGWRAGVIALLFMTVSPRLFGEAFNNAKDPTFAAAYMMAIYGLLCYIDELPTPSWRRAIFLMLGLGLAFGIRAGGVILFAYTIMFVGLALLLREEWRNKLLSFDIKFYSTLLLQIAVMFAGAWIIGIMTWPAALRSPISHPLYALKLQSSYPTVIRVLFGGEYIQSNEIPWSYNLTYIYLTSPVIVILGLLLGFGLLPFIRRTFKPYHLFMILFVSLFPLFYIVYKKSALYNGWRHSYFTYTGLAVFAALAFEALFRMIKSKIGEYVLYAVLIIGIALPGSFMIKNFPIVYVYFNELAGGVDGTYGDYQLDYYACSAKPAADWLRANVPYNDKLKVVSNNPWELNTVWESDKSKQRSTYIRYRERNEQDWDYAIFLPQFVDPNMMKKGYFPPKGTVHTIKVGNATVACIVKRESKEDMLGIEALKKNDINTALPHLEAAIKLDNSNEIALAYLGIAYASIGRKQEGLNMLAASMNISPEYQLPQMYYSQLMGGQK
jgi:hypothetical protein